MIKPYLNRRTTRQAKAKVKTLIWRLQRYRPSPNTRHVALFASRRGGSTWLMEVISANPAFRYIAQPFVSYAGSGKSGHDVFNVDYAHYLDPSVVELEHIRRFISDLLTGTRVFRAPWEFWSQHFWKEKTRTVLKVLQAKPLMTWLETTFDLQVIYLLRHPVAQAASVIKAGWPDINRAFLTHPTFAERHLTESQRRCCEYISGHGSILEKHVLSWSLDNLLPLRELSKDKTSWLVLTYEDCLIHPDMVIDRLSKTLDIDSTRFMHEQFKKASGTTKITHHRNPPVFGEEQLTKWTQQFSTREIANAFQILETLEIDAYNTTSPMALESYRFPLDTSTT
jgi:hypothetical protein